MLLAKSYQTIFRTLPLAIITAATILGSNTNAMGKTLDWDDGVNIQAGYFNGSDKGNIHIGWELMTKFDQIKTVRIEIPPDQDVSMATMQSWIRNAAKNGYKAIATYHRYQDNGSSDPAALIAAANWWRENYTTLSKAGLFTINLMNEWGGHSLTPEQYADAYNEAIGIVRKVYNGPIIVDIPGWGQETVTAKKASPLIKDRNIVYSVHIYSSAFVEQGAHRWMQPEDLVEFATVDRPVIIGEFGGMREGGADWAALVDQSKALGWTVLAWAWNGDGEGMNMVLPSWNDDWNPKAYYPSSYFAPTYGRLGEVPTPEMTLSVQKGITLGPWASSYIFAVHSNASWTLTTDADWLECLNPKSGYGTQTISLSVLEYKGEKRRSGTITVKCGDIVRSFPITQNGRAAHNSAQ